MDEDEDEKLYHESSLISPGIHTETKITLLQDYVEASSNNAVTKLRFFFKVESMRFKAAILKTDVEVYNKLDLCELSRAKNSFPFEKGKQTIKVLTTLTDRSMADEDTSHVVIFIDLEVLGSKCGQE